MEERDKRGRFVKGNQEGKKFKAGGQQSELAKKAAEVSKAVRQERKSVQEQAKMLWETVMTNKKGEKKEMGDIILAQLGVKAMGGDLKAIKLFVQLMGEYLVKNEVTGKDGAPLISDNKEELMKELERLREATK